MSIHESAFTNEQGAAATETATAVLAGYEMAGPQEVGTGDRFYALPVSTAANLELIDVESLKKKHDEKFGEHPARKRGTVHVHDAASFIEYLSKHGLAASEVYADTARQRLVAVVNAHAATDTNLDEGIAGHGDHRIELELLPTEEWKAWTALDKKLLVQSAFAEHLEDNAADVVDPDAATMLEIASSLIATTGADFKSGIRLDNGQVQFRFEETTTARAGHSGDLDIPTEFTIAIAPFVGSDPVELTARFRYRINNGALGLSYALLRPEQVARQAFLDHVEAVRDAIAAPVYLGRPE